LINSEQIYIKHKIKEIILRMNLKNKKFFGKIKLNSIKQEINNFKLNLKKRLKKWKLLFKIYLKKLLLKELHFKVLNIKSLMRNKKNYFKICINKINHLLKDQLNFKLS
jgi:hypothetical protein